MDAQRGLSLIEAVVVLFLIASMLAVAVPSLSALRDRGRAESAARYLATELQLLRWQSVARRRANGLLFEDAGDGWQWYCVKDGNGNGLRTAEVRRGVDATLSGPHRLEHRVEGVRLGFPPGGPFPKLPPESGIIEDAVDPVQFGRSDLVAFSPLGRSSSGTLYLTDGRHGLFALVLFGPAARVRVWRYDDRSKKWTL
jgi:type II secretory pathway pseudopilin PulG